MEDEAQRRIGANEALFREVNEGIARGQWPGEEDAPVGFRCECARTSCNQLVELSMREYERVRGNPRRFLMVAGHELAGAETVVESGARYVVVEKREAAARVAERENPRD